MAGISANHYVTHIDHTLERGAGFVFEGCFGLKEGGGRADNKCIFLPCSRFFQEKFGEMKPA